MTKSQANSDVKATPRLSLDTWAVLVALFAAVLVRLGLIHVPW